MYVYTCIFTSTLYMYIYCYPALVLFEQANGIAWINFCYILSLTEIYLFLIPLSHVTCTVELWKPNCKSSSLPVDRKYQKRESRDNYTILLFNSKYKRQWINVIFMQDKHIINAVS